MNPVDLTPEAASLAGDLISKPTDLRAKAREPILHLALQAIETSIDLIEAPIDLIKAIVEPLVGPGTPLHLNQNTPGACDVAIARVTTRKRIRGLADYDRPMPKAQYPPTEQAPRPVSESRSELIRWMSIQDANSAGFVHGGVVMRMCDEVAGIAAIRHCGARVVTAGMDRMTFSERVYVGELLRCIASVNAVWRTSMEVGVRVEAENAVTREVRHTSTAYLTMVAVSEHGKPMPVPQLEVSDETERRRQREAETRRRNRLAEREEILQHRNAE